MRKHLSLVALAALTLLVSAASAAASPITITYSFAGSLGDQASEPVDAQVAGLTASDITRSSGLTAVGGVNSINSAGWTTAGSADPTDYYEWTFTPDPGFALDFATVDFTWRRSLTGPRVWVLRYSDDNFATSAQVFSNTLFDVDTNSRISAILGVPAPIGSLPTFTTAVTFRLYGFAAEGSLGTLRLGTSLGDGVVSANNLEFTADLTQVAAAPVPEPATLSLLGLGLVGAAGVRRRRQR